MKRKLRIHSIWVIFGIVFFILFGCGKKGPPLPPEIKGQIIAAPFDLTYTVDKTRIALSWKHKIDGKTAIVKPEGFEIFRVKKTFEDCEGCPFAFEKIGLVSVPSMEFVSKIEKGFKYYFRVQAIGDNDMRSEFSKTVQYEYK